MNAKIFLVLRIIFGLFLLVFGANKFLQFMPMGEMSEGAGAYFGALMSAKVLPLVAVVEILTGLALLLNKYAALLLLILMSVSVNAVLFHATLNPEGIGPAAILLILNIVLLYHYRDRFKDILKA